MLMRAPLLLSALQLATSGHFLGAPLPLTRSVLSEAQEIAQVPTTSQVEVLAPGLVIIRNALSEEEQKLLASSTETLGRRAGRGFRNRNGDLNADAGRGRIYDKASQLPRCFRRLCSKVVSQAMALDSAMPSCAPSHVLINHYTTTKGLLWHRDIYANDGDGDHERCHSHVTDVPAVTRRPICSLNILFHPFSRHILVILFGRRRRRRRRKLYLTLHTVTVSCRVRLTHVSRDDHVRR